MGTLYLVATPIGNLEDITQRAIRILSSAALIAAEDTRQTRKLLDHYGIRTATIAYHEHNKLIRIEPILAALAGGDVALVSDAGTPALNDPGYELVRATLAAGYAVSPVPGPSAPLAALVVSGLPTDAFIYLGYLPRRAGERREFIRKSAALPYTLIFLETPHRLKEALEDLRWVLGDRQMAAARELTKLHEEIRRGTIGEVLEHFKAITPRGEFTLVVAAAAAPAGIAAPAGVAAPAGLSRSIAAGGQRWDEAELQTEIDRRLAEGASPSQAAAELAAASGWTRREVYRRMIKKVNSAQ